MTSGTTELVMMTSDSAGLPQAPQPTRPAPRALQWVLVATDGSPASDGALRVADLLANRDEVAVQVLSVLEPEPGPGAGLFPRRLAEKVERRFAHVREQVRGVIGEHPTWRTAINIGPVGETICRMAEAISADMIVVGFGQHRRVHDREPDKATVRAIAEMCVTPVLVVPSQGRTLPHRAMLALDFSRSSIRAGRAALQLLVAPAVMHLVYVHASQEPFPAAPADPDSTDTAGFEPFFEAVERELRPPPGVTFERAVVPYGDPVVQLLAHAAANEVDLIALGKHGKAAHERFHMGSVSTGVLRSAQCLVLVSGGSDPRPRDEAAAIATTLNSGRGDP